MDVFISVGRRHWCAAMIPLLLVCCGCRSWSPWSTAKDAPREQPQDVYTAMVTSQDAGASAAGPTTQFPPGQVASAYPLPPSASTPAFAGTPSGPSIPAPPYGGPLDGFGVAAFNDTPTISHASFTGNVGDPLPGVSVGNMAGFGSSRSSDRSSESRRSSSAGQGCSSG